MNVSVWLWLMFPHYFIWPAVSCVPAGFAGTNSFPTNYNKMFTLSMETALRALCHSRIVYYVTFFTSVPPLEALIAGWGTQEFSQGDVKHSSRHWTSGCTCWCSGWDAPAGPSPFDWCPSEWRRLTVFSSPAGWGFGSSLQTSPAKHTNTQRGESNLGRKATWVVLFGWNHSLHTQRSKRRSQACAWQWTLTFAQSVKQQQKNRSVKYFSGCDGDFCFRGWEEYLCTQHWRPVWTRCMCTLPVKSLDTPSYAIFILTKFHSADTHWRHQHQSKIM